MCQHRSSGLRQDVLLGEGRTLGSEVYVPQTAVSSFDVGVVRAEHLGGPVQTLGLRTVFCTCGGCVLDESSQFLNAECGDFVGGIEEVLVSSGNQATTGSASLEQMVTAELR